MDLRKFYKRENNIRAFNSVKYYVISLVLDILVRRMVVRSSKDMEISFADRKLPVRRKDLARAM